MPTLITPSLATVFLVVTVVEVVQVLVATAALVYASSFGPGIAVEVWLRTAVLLRLSKAQQDGADEQFIDDATLPL